MYLFLAILFVILFLLVNFVFPLKYTILFYLEGILFVLFFSIMFFIKRIKEQDAKSQLSRELPFFLNDLASDLEKNIPLKLSLEHQATKKTAIGKKIAKALELVSKKGYDLESALNQVSKDNLDLKRVVYQINDILQSGTINKSETFRILSNNFIEQQGLAMKNYSTKLNFLSLIFVVVSAIVPALFLMFFLIGSNFFEISFSVEGIIVITVVVFPIIDMFILLFMRANLV